MLTNSINLQNFKQIELELILIHYTFNVSKVFCDAAISSGPQLLLSENETQNQENAVSLWGGNMTKFMTFNCDISITSWHMKVSDRSFSNISQLFH